MMFSFRVCKSNKLKSKISFFERNKTTLTYNQVVQNLDIQKLSSFDQGAGDGDIVIIYMENLLTISK